MVLRLFATLLFFTAEIATSLILVTDTRSDASTRRSNELVIYNEHNSTARNNGAKIINVYLFRKGDVVWSKENVQVDWSTRDDLETIIEVPEEEFDAIKIDITAWYENGGGLSEVELWQDGKNVALGKYASTSKPHREGGETRGPWCVTDGIKSSKVHLEGYWLLPDGEAGSVMIDLKKPAKRKTKLSESARELRSRKKQPTSKDP